MQWTHIRKVYESELRTAPSATGVFDQETEEGNKRWEDLRKRVVEHVSKMVCENHSINSPSGSFVITSLLCRGILLVAG